MNQSVGKMWRKCITRGTKAFPFVISFYAFEKKIQRIALADLRGIESLIDHCAAFSRRACGIVGAVIGANEGGYKLVGIGLVFDAFDQVGYNLALVSCGYKYSYPVGLRLFMLLSLGKQNHENCNG